MNVSIEATSELRRKVTIELEGEDITPELDRTYRELGRQTHLKGFRPGRAPRRILERLFGDHVRSEVMQRLIKESTDKALKEHELSPVAEPEIITEESDFPRTLRFSVVFDLRPQIEVRDYRGIRINRPAASISDEEVERVLEELRRRNAPLRKVEGRERVEAGDFVLAELSATVDGKPLDGIPKDARLFEVSEQTLPHGLHELLIGAEVGREAHLARTYPPDYPEAELAGKAVEWRAVVREIRYRELPALDDEFARDQGDFENLDALRAHLRSQLLEQARARAEERTREQLVEQLSERNPVVLPESLVARELTRMEAEREALLRSSGIAPERLEADREAARRNLRELAERRVRHALLLEAVADQEKVEVSDDELAERIAQAVKRAGRDRERVAKFYADEANREHLRRTIRHEKTLDFLMSHAQVDEQPDAASQPPAEG